MNSTSKCASVPAGCPAKLPRGRAAADAPRQAETSAFMTAAALLALIRRADEKISYEQLRTWVVSQAIRNALQTFHGGYAFDPDHPDQANRSAGLL